MTNVVTGVTLNSRAKQGIIGGVQLLFNGVYSGTRQPVTLK
jgi:hypothetical protein